MWFLIMGFILATAPSSEPISLEEAKVHLRVDHSDEDSFINGLIKTARQHVESAWDCALIDQTTDLYLDDFPRGAYRAIEIPRPPLKTVTHIKYIDAATGVLTTLASTEYKLVTATLPGRGRIVEAYNKTWPTPRMEADSVVVRFANGYGAAGSAVPAPIRQGMLLIIGHLFKRREIAISGTIISEIPFAAEALLAGELGLRYA